jgi:hypothetical protein
LNFVISKRHKGPDFISGPFFVCVYIFGLIFY